MSVAPDSRSIVPSDPSKRSPSPKWLLLNVDCHVTTRSGNSSVTAMVSGTSRPSFSEKTPPDIAAATGTGRSHRPLNKDNWHRLFPVTLSPRNSQDTPPLHYTN